MNKNILFACFFVLIMLLVSTSSVVGVSDIEDNCNCNVEISSYNRIKLEKLIVRTQFFIHIIKLRHRNNPYLQENCDKLLEIIKSDGLWDNFCDFLINLSEFLWDFADNNFEPRSKMYELFYAIGFIIFDAWDKLCVGYEQLCL